MADEEHLEILKQGVDIWNKWREEYPKVRPNLSEVDLYDAALTRANLSYANLRKASLSYDNLAYANLLRADLSEANLSYANLRKANLSGAYLSGAYLVQATLVETEVTDATFTDCIVYGTSVWNLQGEPKQQNNLHITREWENEPPITVDNIEVAQFIYMLRESKKIREVLTTLTTKAVLLLGRFGERKYVLDEIAEVLRNKGYITIIFDFEKPDDRDLLDTVKTLALLSKFVIIDMTDPHFTPYELSDIAPLLIPIQPLIQAPEAEPPALTVLRRKHHWLLQTHCYQDLDSLRESLENELLDVVEVKAAELKARE